MHTESKKKLRLIKNYFLLLLFPVVFLIALFILYTKNISKAVTVIGSGATFPYPFYQSAINEYNAQSKTEISYTPLGSTGGMRQLLQNNVAFAGSDALYTDSELESMGLRGRELIWIPTCVGSVVIAYNLPGNPVIKLTGEIISDMYLGKIKKWNDARLLKINPSAELPDKLIIPFRRQDGSGTTFIFTDYLSKVSPAWKNTIGTGSEIKWPVGTGVKGNGGVADSIKVHSYSLGYINGNYAIEHGLRTAEIMNKSGNYISPDIENVTLAAAQLPDDNLCSLLNNTAHSGGYPIASFTWIVFFKQQKFNGQTIGDAHALFSFF